MVKNRISIFVKNNIFYLSFYTEIRLCDSIGTMYDKRKKYQFQMCFWMVAQLPQRIKSMFFEIFSSLQVSLASGILQPKFFQKTLILGFEANSALSRENGLFSAF